MIMNYVLQPFLQHTALVKVAAILWNQGDVKNLLTEFNYDKYAKCQSSSWKKIETIVAEKVAKLPLPKQTKEKISCFITPVGFQIKQLKHFLYNDCRVRVDLPNEFCWTSQGTIDRKKTAEVMIKDEGIDITTRYSLACIHCLEDDIPKLWDKIPKGCRTSFYSTPYHYVLPLVEFWTYYIKENIYKMNRMITQEVRYSMPLYEYAFKSALYGYRVAAEYFLQKLTVLEADLVRTAMNIAYEGDNYADLLCFLLSYLDEEEQMRVFESNPSGILRSLLDYPFQHFFMDTANCMWNILEKDDYAFVLGAIAFKIIDGSKDFDYQKLLGEFWQKIPVDHKRYVFSQSAFYSIIRDRVDRIKFGIRDEDISVISFPIDKKRIFYHDIAQDICKKLLNGKDLLSLLKYFITECLPSKDEVIRFKEHLESGEIDEVQFKFLRVLDEVIFEFNERKHEEDDNSKVKKVCSAEFSDMIPSSEKKVEEYCT